MLEATNDDELETAMAWHKANPETLEEKAARIADAYTLERPELLERVYEAALATLKGEPAIPVVIDYKTGQVVDVALRSPREDKFRDARIQSEIAARTRRFG